MESAPGTVRPPPDVSPAALGKHHIFTDFSSLRAVPAFVFIAWAERRELEWRASMERRLERAGSRSTACFQANMQIKIAMLAIHLLRDPGRT
jgi:hypothetical protein